jgi:hypothetical protein
MKGDPGDQGVTYIDGAAGSLTPRRELARRFRGRTIEWRDAVRQVLAQQAVERGLQIPPLASLGHGRQSEADLEHRDRCGPNLVGILPVHPDGDGGVGRVAHERKAHRCRAKSRRARSAAPAMELGQLLDEAKAGRALRDSCARPCRLVFGLVLVGGSAQDLPRFLLHAAAAPHRTALQPLLHRVVQVAHDQLGDGDP